VTAHRHTKNGVSTRPLSSRRCAVA